jgi:hypothetical protein
VRKSKGQWNHQWNDVLGERYRCRSNDTKQQGIRDVQQHEGDAVFDKRTQGMGSAEDESGDHNSGKDAHALPEDWWMTPRGNASLGQVTYGVVKKSVANT